MYCFHVLGLPHPISRRMISFSSFLQGNKVGSQAKTFSWKNSKSSVEEEGGAGGPCQLLLGGDTLFFFPGWLIGEACRGHASSSPLTWYGKKEH